jgi:hypothetical protein
MVTHSPPNPVSDVGRNGWIPFLPQLQSKGGRVTVEALEAILSRSMVSILRQMEDKPLSW